MMQIDLAPPPPQTHQLVLVRTDRFAVFADLASRADEPQAVRMRAFQVVEANFAVGETRYWGGWSWWRFDCQAGSADRLDFSAVQAGGREGPVTADSAAARPIEPETDAAALARVACGPAPEGIDASTVEEAVTLGRARLAG